MLFLAGTNHGVASSPQPSVGIFSKEVTSTPCSGIFIPIQCATRERSDIPTSRYLSTGHVKKPLQQFSGSLTPQKIADGMNAAARNAMRLFEDAEAMAKVERYPTACALAVLA